MDSHIFAIRLALLAFVLNCDGAIKPETKSASAPATSSLDIASLAIATGIVPDMTLNVLADTRGRVHPRPLVAKRLTLADKSASGSPLSYRIAQGAAQGTATLDGFNLIYEPDGVFAGSDLVSIVANNGVADTEERTITFVAETGSIEPRALPDFRPTTSQMVGKPETFAAARGIGAASVAFDSTRDIFVMAFESRYALADADCTAGYWGIGMASSKDGAAWEQNDDMVIKPKDGTDHACIAAQPSLIHDGEKFHLFFKMHAKPNAQDGIGYATARNGKLFSAPVKISSGVKNSPTAVKFGNRIYVYYLHKNETGYAVSREWSGNGGKTWDGTKNATRAILATRGAWANNTPFAEADRFDALSVVYDANDAETPFKILLVASIATGSANSAVNPSAVGALLESVDGENWKISADLPMTPNPAWRRNPEMLLEGNDYLLWHDATDGEGRSEILFMTTLVKWP